MHAPDQAQDLRWMRRAIGLTALCPPAAGAYSVGAVIVAEDGTELAAGYSREADPREHAEEAALAKLPAGVPRLATATIYSSLEPCSQRSADRTPRTQRPLFVADYVGVGQLAEAGVDVVELPELAETARAVNSHLGLS